MVNSKRNANAAGLPSDERESPQRRRHMLTREERSKIRILAQYHLQKADIAELMFCSIGTVQNVIKKVGSARNDRDDDYLYVDKEFAARHPRRIEMKKKVKVEGSLPSISIQKRRELVVPPSPRSPRSPRQKLTSRHDHNSSMIQPMASVSSHKGSNHSKSRTCHNPIDLTRDAPERPNAKLSVSEFLSKLEHDLSCLLPALAKQDLATPQELFALAGWGEGDLHMLLKEALPSISVTQRFILVKGLKKMHV